MQPFAGLTHMGTAIFWIVWTRRQDKQAASSEERRSSSLEACTVTSRDAMKMEHSIIVRVIIASRSF